MTPTLQEQLEQVLAEAKHVERRARLLKQLTAQALETLQSEEDTRNNVRDQEQHRN